MPIRPRLEVERLTPDAHGGIDEAELERLGLEGCEILDFSVNVNPFGPSPKVGEALTQVDIARYPDPSATRLRRLIAGRYGLSPEQVLVGNGSVELIRLAAFAYLTPNDRVLIAGPTFGEYRVSSALTGAEVEAYTASAKEDFQVDVEGLAEVIATRRPKLVFLCNPNNPTGWYLTTIEIEHLLSACRQSLLILDEAYVSFVKAPWSSIPLLDWGNLLILRSLTKDCALAGLRLGYALAQPEVIEPLRRVRQPWSVNALAQAAAQTAFADEAHLRRALAATTSAKEGLAQNLQALGLRVFPSATHFFLVEVGDAPAFRLRLLQKGFLVRDCTSFGLPGFIRIAARRPEENKKLVQVIAGLLQDGWEAAR